MKRHTNENKMTYYCMHLFANWVKENHKKKDVKKKKSNLAVINAYYIDNSIRIDNVKKTSISGIVHTIF